MLAAFASKGRIVNVRRKQFNLLGSVVVTRIVGEIHRDMYNLNCVWILWACKIGIRFALVVPSRGPAATEYQYRFISGCSKSAIFTFEGLPHAEAAFVCLRRWAFGVPVYIGPDGRRKAGCRWFDPNRL